MILQPYKAGQESVSLRSLKHSTDGQSTVKTNTIMRLRKARWPSGRASDPERQVGGSILTQVAVLYP